jgi:hypothetical protein
VEVHLLGISHVNVLVLEHTAKEISLCAEISYIGESTSRDFGYLGLIVF